MSGTGYAKPIIKIDFPELSRDPVNDPIWVVIKNPQLLPPKTFRAGAQEQAAAEAVKAAKDAGQIPRPEDTDASERGTHAMAGGLVVAWRVYDPASVPQIDPLTGEETGEGGQVLLPPPSGGGGVSAEEFGKLPLPIQMAVLNKITEALDPQAGQEAPTSKRSSGSRKASMTAPGAEGQ